MFTLKELSAPFFMPVWFECCLILEVIFLKIIKCFIDFFKTLTYIHVVTKLKPFLCHDCCFGSVMFGVIPSVMHKIPLLIYSELVFYTIV